MALTLVLSTGLDPDLLSTRNLVLQSAGYSVVSAYSIKEAVDRLQADDFDLVLLCQSIPTKDRDHLTLWIRASGLRIPVVSVAGKFRQNDPFTGVTVDSDPAALLMGIREVLIGAEILAARTVTAQDKEEAAAAIGKKQPTAGTANEQQAKTAKAGLVPLARAG